MVMKDPATRRSRGFGFITFTQASSVGKVQLTLIYSLFILSLVLKLPISIICFQVLNYPAHQLDGKLIEPKVAVPRKSNPKLVKTFLSLLQF